MSSSAQELLPRNLDLGDMFGALFIGAIVAALLATDYFLCSQS